MAAMTKADLTELIKEVTLPVIRDTVGKDVADLVREQVEKAISPLQKQQSDWGSRMFGSQTQETKKGEPGTDFAKCIRAMAAAKLSGAGPEKALDILKTWGHGDLAEKWSDVRSKAQSAGDPTGGGFLVPPQFSTDVIELLRPASVVRALGARNIPMPNGTLKVPKITGGTSASYVGENSNISKTEATFGQLTLTFKKLAAVVPISNDLIRYSSPNADAVVRDDVIRAMAQREDQAFIRDNGTNAGPRGLKYWVNDANKLSANASVSLANVTTDLGRMLQALMAANIPLVVQQQPEGASGAQGGWIFSPRTYRYLTTLQTTIGSYAFRDEMLRGTLWGFPFRVTTQVQETLTSAGAETGGTQTEVYFGAFTHAIIGESMGLMVDASQEAAYYDGSSVVAAFSQDQTVVRVIAEHDFALRHDKAFALLQNVTWGA